jgi:acyl-CoA reductase-like NAD-dependent aldehyde dehydrogenase
MSVTQQTRPNGAIPLRHAQMLIAGAWVESASGETLGVENPGRKQKIAEILRGGAADVDRAVQAATQAFSGWSMTPPRDRGRLLLWIAEALEARGEELASTIALETGQAR